MVRVRHHEDRQESAVFEPLERPRLIERIAASTKFPIALIIAPAGYGKSVALRQYLQFSDRPNVRFVLRAEHASFLSFLRGFAETLVAIAPHAVTALAEAYERNQVSPKRTAELARWMNAHLEAFSGIIAIDNLHIGDDDEEVAKYITLLIEQTKDRIQWILGSRSTTGLPVASWLAYRDADFPIDERDLRSTFDEARDAAGKLGLLINKEELRDLLELTEGWPAAMSFALRTSTRSSDLRNVSAVTRDMIYRFLAEQVYATLDVEQQNLLEVAIALPTIDIKILERAGFDRALQIVERLQERTAFIYEESPGVYECHDLFREFLRHQSALGGKRAQQNGHERAGRALEASGDIEHAIGAYVAAGACSDLLRLLERHGFDLLERARSDVLSSAIEALDEKIRRENATVLALRGALYAIAGKFARAESLMRRALERSEGNRDLFAATSLRFAAMMANQGHDARGVLERVSADSGQNAANRAEAISIIAAQEAVNGRCDVAASAAERAEEMLSGIESDIVRARLLQRIGIAYHHLGSAKKAFRALSQCCELAEEAHLFGITSRANAVLSNLVLHELDDVAEQLRYANLAASAATKAGDSFALQTALLQILSAQMRKGEVEGSIAIEQRLTPLKASELAQTYVAIFRSTRLAWEGRFGEAHRLLSSCWGDMNFSFDRISCGGEYALFLALDGRRDESAVIVKEILTSLRSQVVTGLYCVRASAITKALCALTEAINGRATRADRILNELRSNQDDVVRATLSAVEKITATLQQRIEDGTERVRESLKPLTDLGYTDIARLLGAVDAAATNAAGEVQRPSGFTPSEIDVLRLLEQGLTPKEIAERTSRSIYTVRVHIANAIAKLGCHGRSEAIRMANRLNLI
jgi:ATP/maltotriose-dependent transcriptional regulator MalT